MKIGAQNATDYAKDKMKDFLNPDGSITEIVGEGGKVRHRGAFGDDNPYFQQLQYANNNQDKDALYELAIQWEADRANLLEQREYEDPINQIKRQRAAGINPDIAAGGSGAGTSAGSSAQIADQTGQTKFSNKYDNTHLALEGINTAVNAVGTFVGAYGTIADSITKFKALPSQIASNEAGANLANAQAGEINSLLSGKKKSLDLGNALQFIDTIGGLSSMIAPDADDESFNNLVASAGIPEAERAGAVSAIRSAQKNPEFLQNYKNNILADRQAQAQLEHYTSEVFSKLIDEQLQLEQMGLDFQIMQQSIANKVKRFLYHSPEYQENLADIEMMGAELGAQNLELAKEQLKRDFNAYGTHLQSIVDGITQLETRNAELDEFRKKRKLSPPEQLEYDTNLLRVSQLYGLGSQQVGEVYAILNDANRQKFYLVNNTNYSEDRGLTPGLGVVGTGLDDDTIIYGQIGFKEVVNGAYTTQQLAQEWSKIAIQGASTAAQTYIGYKLGGAAGKAINAPKAGAGVQGFGKSGNTPRFSNKGNIIVQ